MNLATNVLWAVRAGSREAAGRRAAHVRRQDGRRPHDECQRRLRRDDAASDSSAVDSVRDPPSPSSATPRTLHALYTHCTRLYVTYEIPIPIWRILILSQILLLLYRNCVFVGIKTTRLEFRISFEIKYKASRTISFANILTFKILRVWKTSIR